MMKNHPRPRILGNIGRFLEHHPIRTSAPCRIDFGGTLDISTFNFPLRRQSPATVNIALNRRTVVTLNPEAGGCIRISSQGFSDAVFPTATAPYDHPLGLMFAIADYFGVQGVHIDIKSTSPPKSGLGGSSVAAVALIAAFSKVFERMGTKKFTRHQIALLAHAVEQAAAGAPCGIQDQLAAAFGGVNAWSWPAIAGETPYRKKQLVKKDILPSLNRCLLVAYLGVTHVSGDVNGTWVRQFISGRHRKEWNDIVDLTHGFGDALAHSAMNTAADAMNKETAIRKAMTPDVLDPMGDRLWAAAQKAGCGARFTGAGGGGCMWAIGKADKIAALKPTWKELLSDRPEAGLIDCQVDGRGVMDETV